jgi:hypothetical protein
MTKQESMPAKGLHYRLGEPVFYDPYNDVRFYVEDEEKEHFYFAILSKLFTTAKITKIFPLDGKLNVISEAKVYKPNKKKRKSVFIVDKDFDDLLGKVEVFDHLFYLAHYNVESCLIEPEAIVEYVIWENQKAIKPLDKEKASSNIKKYLDRQLTKSGKLYALYFFCQSKNLSIPNTGRSGSLSMNDKDKTKIDSTKITAYKRELSKTYKAETGMKNFKTEFGKVLSMYNFTDRYFLDRNVCGKFRLFFLREYLKNEFGVANTSTENISYRLANLCRLDKLNDFKSDVDIYLTS